MIFCDNEDLKITSDTEPSVKARTILPSMSKDEIKDIKNKPFICLKNVNFFVVDKRDDEEYRIFIPKGYTWDGATIPFGCRWILGGKGNPEFLISSCVHDKLCENKLLVDYDRYLSSLIFRELLLACGCNKFKANLMFVCVNNYQKLLDWRKK